MTFLSVLTCPGEGSMKAELTAEDQAEGGDADLLVAAVVHDHVQGAAGVTLQWTKNMRSPNS